MNSSACAAEKLEGLTLENGWRVTKLVKREESGTGGNFSTSYIVENKDGNGFLKAFDFSYAFSQKNSMNIMQSLVNAYVYERELLLFCLQKRLRKVVVAVDHGEVQVPGFAGPSGRVYYLIFHLADGDIRSQVRCDQRFDTVWSLGALHDITIGLAQIHAQMIAHQDVKPSNVLLFDKEFRLADFGRASRKGYPATHDDYSVAGDKTYAPPEQLYGYIDSDFNVRRFGCDLYMLGNIAAFMLTGTNFTSQLLARLSPQHRPTQWGGPYADVLPYVISAYAEVLRDLRKEIDPIVRVEANKMISELCHPNLQQRGHPKNIGLPNQYSLERYVSQLDYLTKQTEIKDRIRLKSA